MFYISIFSYLSAFFFVSFCSGNLHLDFRASVLHFETCDFSWETVLAS